MEESCMRTRAVGLASQLLDGKAALQSLGWVGRRGILREQLQVTGSRINHPQYGCRRQHSRTCLHPSVACKHARRLTGSSSMATRPATSAGYLLTSRRFCAGTAGDAALQLDREASESRKVDEEESKRIQSSNKEDLLAGVTWTC